MPHSDVLIIGSGLSGIGIAVHLRRDAPSKTFAILEMREDIGGTWDLFTYPGIRSDSDMYTLGYEFKPWTGAKAIADGPSILRYMRETVDEFQLRDRIRFQRRVTRAVWCSRAGRWEVESVCTRTGEARIDSCSFLVICSGYYSYRGGHRPKFEGEDDFKGRIVHPQDWPRDLDYDDRQVVVIGSGATAVTLVPALAERAARVTMLQRSPTYIASVPAEDRLANAARKVLPAKLAYGIGRWRNILLSLWVYQYSKRHPDRMRRWLLAGVRKALGPSVDIARDYVPAYNPWDQRLCAVPDGDLFTAIRAGRAQVVTDRIVRFTHEGVLLESGRTLDADVIVTATGLDLVFLGEIEIIADGRRLKGADALVYKGCMFDGVPNLAYAFGYTNASWTLKVDLTGRYLTRLLRHMDRIGASIATPIQEDPTVEREETFGLEAGYVRRAASILPKQGSKRPWRMHENYILDLLDLKFGRIDDGVIGFGRHPTSLPAVSDSATEVRQDGH